MRKEEEKETDLSYLWRSPAGDLLEEILKNLDEMAIEAISDWLEIEKREFGGEILYLSPDGRVIKSSKILI